MFSGFPEVSDWPKSSIAVGQRFWLSDFVVGVAPVSSVAVSAIRKEEKLSALYRSAPLAFTASKVPASDRYGRRAFTSGLPVEVLLTVCACRERVAINTQVNNGKSHSYFSVSEIGLRQAAPKGMLSWG